MENKEAIEKMDGAANEARKELDPRTINTSSDPVKEVANWMKKWYPEAGYKRLSKVLIELAD
jgi:tetrahydromethanopterin S-methyltransferase subunit B